MSIYQNVIVRMRRQSFERQQQLTFLVEDALQAVDLWHDVRDKLSAYPDRLTLYQRQRLALASVVMSKPRIILFDESLYFLKADERQNFLEIIDKFRKDYMILIASHHVELIQHFCDDIAVMYGGELVEFGNCKDIIENPQDSRTINYLEQRERS